MTTTVVRVIPVASGGSTSGSSIAYGGVPVATSNPGPAVALGSATAQQALDSLATYGGTLIEGYPSPSGSPNSSSGGQVTIGSPNTLTAITPDGTTTVISLPGATQPVEAGIPGTLNQGYHAINDFANGNYAAATQAYGTMTGGVVGATVGEAIGFAFGDVPGAMLGSYLGGEAGQWLGGQVSSWWYNNFMSPPSTSTALTDTNNFGVNVNSWTDSHWNLTDPVVNFGGSSSFGSSDPFSSGGIASSDPFGGSSSFGGSTVWNDTTGIWAPVVNFSGGSSFGGSDPYGSGGIASSTPFGGGSSFGSSDPFSSSGSFGSSDPFSSGGIASSDPFGVGGGFGSSDPFSSSGGIASSNPFSSFN